MIVTAAGEEFVCDRAVRSGDQATLYLTRGGIVEFSGVSEEGWKQFEITGGSWESAAPTELERLAALEAAMLAVMTGGSANV